jgi:putative acyl-CoA dehydrogenase
MQNVLTDLCIETEASAVMAMRMSAAYDAYYNGNPSIVNCDGMEQAQELFRIGVTVSKYYVTKRLPHLTYECMESLGGNGFTEDWPMAKLFRHSPLNSIWEGSGNVIALDILRGMKSLPILMKEIALGKGMSNEFDSFYSTLEKSLYSMGKDLQMNKNVDYHQRGARSLADSLAVAYQGSLLLRYGDEQVRIVELFVFRCCLSYFFRSLCSFQVAKGYVQSRLSNNGKFSNNYGGNTIYDESLSKYIIERNMPIFEK